MPYDVITIGSATIDLFAEAESELIRLDTRLTHRELIAFDLGSKLLIKQLNTTVGGGGTNTAVAFARLGLHTAFLGKIGVDSQGDVVLSGLAKEHIDFIGKREGQTGLSVVLNSIGNDRTILAYKGANNELHPKDIPELDAPWVYMSSMLEESWDALVHCIEEHDFNLAFNPSAYQAAQGYEALKPVLERTKILVLNREEASKLLGHDPAQIEDMVALIRDLARCPDQTVVITDGGKGVWAKRGNEIIEGRPLPNLTIVETTGAGDAFASTFTAACIMGKSLAEAIDMGMTNSESVLAHKGAKEKLLTLEEMQTALSRNSRQIIIHSPKQ